MAHQGPAAPPATVRRAEYRRANGWLSSGVPWRGLDIDGRISPSLPYFEAISRLAEAIVNISGASGQLPHDVTALSSLDFWRDTGRGQASPRGNVSLSSELMLML